MSASFEGAVAWAHRRRVLVFAGAAVLLVLSFFGLRQLRFDANVLRLLPASGEAVPAFRTFLEQFGSLDDLYVVFRAPEGHAIDEYEDEIEQWVDALAVLPELTRVDSGRPGAGEDWPWLLERELLLLEGDTLDRALGRLQPTQMPAALQSTRELLSVPSPEITAMVQDDPLGLHDLLRQQLGRTHSVLPGRGAGEGYVSTDGQRRLVIARPSEPPYDTDFSHRLFDQLARVSREQRERPPDVDGEARPPLEVVFTGGHRIAIEAEAVVTRESIVNGVGALALILPMLFLVFRSAWLVVIGALPSAVALLVVLGWMGLAGVTLSAAATGASAMLFGLGVDGVVLLYVAHHHAVAEGQSPQAAIRALGAPAASMLLGMWTTAATFLGLMVVDFPSLEQLGLLIGLSMIVCGVMTLLMVPAALSSKPPARRPRSLTLPRLAARIARHRRGVLAGAAVATIVLGYFATTVRIDLTLDRLRSVTTGAQLVQEVTEAFGLPADVYVVLAQGADLQTLLAGSEQLTARLRQTVPEMPFQPPTAILPSQRTQAARVAHIRSRVEDVEQVRGTLEAAAVDAGFRPRTFDRFQERLPRMVAANQAITFEGFHAHGLQHLVDRFVQRTPEGWSLASYAFPSTPGQVAALQAAVDATDGAMVLTGLPQVNAELAAGFGPQFLWGLAVGSLVVFASIVFTFRDVWLSMLTLIPTVLGLTWAAGLLGLAQVELDLFAVFAVVTFVGIGVDYGIHLIHRYRERGNAASAVAELAPVILVAGAITLFGYGTLMTSSYPPLRSIGLVSAVSVMTLVVTSILVLPALLQWKDARGD